MSSLKASVSEKEDYSQSEKECVCCCDCQSIIQFQFIEFIFIHKKFLSAKTARQKKSFCKFNQAVVDHIRTHMKNIQLDIKSVLHMNMLKHV